MDWIDDLKNVGLQRYGAETVAFFANFPKMAFPSEILYFQKLLPKPS